MVPFMSGLSLKGRLARVFNFTIVARFPFIHIGEMPLLPYNKSAALTSSTLSQMT
jgi:hypothetical protein